MSWPRPVRIVGVGSPHGDDAVGWEAVRKLRERLVNVEGVEVHAVDGGQRIMNLLDGCGTLFLIDAFEPNAEPGRLVQFDWPSASIEKLRAGTTHDFRPAEALWMAETLGMMPEKAVLFGVEAGEVSPESPLTDRVVRAVDELVGRIIKVLELEKQDA